MWTWAALVEIQICFSCIIWNSDVLITYIIQFRSRTDYMYFMYLASYWADSVVPTKSMEMCQFIPAEDLFYEIQLKLQTANPHNILYFIIHHIIYFILCPSRGEKNSEDIERFPVKKKSENFMIYSQTFQGQEIWVVRHPYLQSWCREGDHSYDQCNVDRNIWLLSLFSTGWDWSWWPKGKEGPFVIHFLPALILWK